MQFIFRIPSRFMTVFLDLILVSQFTMRYYLENPSYKIKAKFNLNLAFFFATKMIHKII